jgi:two-component system, OmpR family, alkaline phosphatase synthesis response regulator PhoP
MSRVLVIEDNENLAFGLVTSLELDGHEALIAPTGREGLRHARDWRPDLIILDIMLPDVDGYRVLQSLRADGIDAPVLLLTARGEEADRVLGFRLGADDYVTKPFSVLELLARVQTRLRRTAGASGARTAEDEVFTFGDVTVSPAERCVRRGSEVVQLSPKAFDLLIALLKRRGAVASRLQLLQEVWGHKGAVMTRTVDIHVAELRRKLEDSAAEPRHILTVRKAGYRLVRQ